MLCIHAWQSGYKKKSQSLAELIKFMADQYTNEQLAHIRGVFETKDPEKSGVVPTSQMKEVLQALNYHPTDAELQDFLNEVDPEKEGNVDFVTFVTFLPRGQKDSSYLQQQQKQDLYDSCGLFDKAGSGRISSEDMLVVLNSMDIDISDKELEELIEQFSERDSDGCFNYRKFLDSLFTQL